jgi:hypothetical protein
VIGRGPAALILAVSLASCAGGAEGAEGPRPGPGLPPPLAAPLVRSLPAGTVLRLLPCREVVPVGRGRAGVDTGFVDALLREALRLSARFDLAADQEDGPSRYALAPRIDAAAGQLSISLEEDGAPPTPLAAVPIGADAVPAAVDVAALTVRAGLGDTAAAPPPIADLYSASAECVAATERALLLDGGAAPATLELIQRARRADPGCALAWNALASWQLAHGEAEEAARTAQTALSTLSRRLAPTTAQRLARVLLLARARAAGPGAARGIDEQLLALGEAFVEDRPHDPHGRYTRALAQNFLGAFAAARADLEHLLPRWPKVPWIPYHLAFACLGTGDGEAALAAIELAARRLPFGTVFLPRALALHAAGELDELDEFLGRAQGRETAEIDFGHQVLRMRAALALLRGRREAAIAVLLEDLEWLRQRPSLLEERSLDLAEAGEVLVRLGAGAELPHRLDPLRAVPSLAAGPSLALAYVEGLWAAGSGEDAIAQIALQTLERAQRDAWATQVRAARARHAGDVATEARELATAVRLDDSPLCRAAFARALEGLGRRSEAQALLAETRGQLLRIDLRLPLEHPLLSPGRALAFLATEPR